MTAAAFTLSQTWLDQLAQKEAQLAYKLGLGRMVAEAAVDNEASLAEKAFDKGLVLFAWICNENEC
jgi:hypothetical protein